MTWEVICMIGLFSLLLTQYADVWSSCPSWGKIYTLIVYSDENAFCWNRIETETYQFPATAVHVGGLTLGRKPSEADTFWYFLLNLFLCGKIYYTCLCMPSYGTAQHSSHGPYPIHGVIYKWFFVYTQPKYCFIWNHCITLWNWLQFGEMHVFRMISVSIFVWLLYVLLQRTMCVY